jgi:hypothetical protein
MNDVPFVDFPGVDQGWFEPADIIFHPKQDTVPPTPLQGAPGRAGPEPLDRGGVLV